MTKKSKMCFSEQEKLYIDHLKQAKAKLDKLKEKRALEIGNLAIKAGLGDMSDNSLTTAFNKIAK